ncbi:unnamed protein product, partial [Heterosigma akashiwo]
PGEQGPDGGAGHGAEAGEVRALQLRAAGAHGPAAAVQPQLRRGRPRADGQGLAAAQA